MVKKSTSGKLEVLKKSFEGYETFKYLNERIENYLAELVTDFRTIYHLDFIKEIEEENYVSVVILTRALESNTNSWYFTKKFGHARPFTSHEAIAIHHFESAVRMNLKKTDQKKFKVEKPWKDENVKKLGTKKLSTSIVDKLLSSSNQ